jgi:hypothetical protein
MATTHKGPGPELRYADERQPHQVLAPVLDVLVTLSNLDWATIEQIRNGHGPDVRDAWGRITRARIDAAYCGRRWLQEPAIRGEFTHAARRLLGLTVAEVDAVYEQAEEWLHHVANTPLLYPLDQTDSIRQLDSMFRADEWLDEGRHIVEQFRRIADQVERDRLTIAAEKTPTAEPGLTGLAALRRFTDSHMKGSERKIVLAVCDRPGARIPLKDLAALVDWEEPWADCWNSARRRINRKIEPIGWQLQTHDQAAKLVATDSN